MAPWSFSHGASTDIGGRKENQDEHVFVEAVFPGSSWSLYGVFDGHGDLGQKVARFVKKELPLEISAKSNPASLVADPAKVLTDAFAAVNERLRENEDIDTYMSGTTAAVLLACRETGTLIVGHVGDCKVVVGVAGPSEAPKTLTS
jgi:serine/threonine protein phosphatase PrpC